MFGEVLKTLRLSRGVKQAELARYLNVDRATISKYETNERNPSVKNLAKIAEFFNVSTDCLITGKDKDDQK